MYRQGSHWMHDVDEHSPECRDDARAVAALVSGDELHRCTRLGRSATSDVYRIAFPDSSAPDIVVKLLKQSLSAVPSVCERFQNECALLTRVNHSALPKIVHFGTMAGRPYLAYRCIEGDSLLHRLQRGPHADTAGLRQGYAILRSLLDALVYLHNLDPPLVHSDISPENVIVSTGGGAHLIDFGCAQPIVRGTVLDSRWIGKPSYLSPEQAQGRSWDHRSDLYQTGVISYEMLTGRKKINATSRREAMLLASNPGYADLSPVPSALRTMLRRVLEPDPADRWQTARDVLQALDEIGA